MRIVHIQYLNEKINFEVEASMSMEKLRYLTDPFWIYITLHKTVGDKGRIWFLKIRILKVSIEY